MLGKRKIEYFRSFKFLFGLIIVYLLITYGVFAQTKADKRILEAEKLLSDLGYWVLKVDGIADSSTKHALIAFQKVEKRKRTGILNESEIKALRKASRPRPKFQGEKHIEVDLSRQVLFFVDENGIITHILPVSTGNNQKYEENGKWEIAYTPRGTFQVFRQKKGAVKAPLGILYYPNYFYKGVAIHGSDSIPIYPASHGCVRIPRFADKALQEMITIGMKVYVYD